MFILIAHRFHWAPSDIGTQVENFDITGSINLHGYNIKFRVFFWDETNMKSEHWDKLIAITVPVSIVILCLFYISIYISIITCYTHEFFQMIR